MIEEFNTNMVILSDVAEGNVTDSAVIETIFFEIFQNMKTISPLYTKKFLQWFRFYFQFLGKFLVDVRYQGDDFIKYRKDVLLCLKNLIQQKQYFHQIKKEFLKCQKEEKYSKLPLLYTLFFKLLCAMDIQEYYLVETGNMLNYATRHITYLPKKEVIDPFYYDAVVKESMLELKNS